MIALPHDPEKAGPQKYSGTMKRHNVCKRHVAIDTGFKQTEGAIFLHVISMG